MENTNSILEMAKGAIAEQVNLEVGRVVANILEPNNAIETALSIGTMNGQIVAVAMVPQVPGQINMSGEEQQEAKILKFAVNA